MKRYKQYSEKNSNVSVKGGDIVNRAIPEPVILKPLQVEVHNNFDRAFKAFRAIVQKDGVLSKFKEKQSYEKPSVRRRRKKNEARRARLEEQNNKE